MKYTLLTKAGTYIVVINIKKSQKIQIGKIGTYNIVKGYYFYVGSAHGPGGIRSRILRHLKQNKAKHWHIDYLREAGTLEAMLISYSKKKKECAWASRLNSYPISTPINGFGSTDCSCTSHLFFGKANLEIELLTKIVKDPVDYLTIS